MPRLTVTIRDGDEHVLTGAAGTSVMEVVRDDGIDELLALCGGCLSCTSGAVVAAERLADTDMPLEELLDG